MTGEAAVKPKVRTDEIKSIISQIHSTSIDVRDKTYMLATAVDRTGKEPEAPSANIGDELVNSLNDIQRVLRDAYDTLSAFV